MIGSDGVTGPVLIHPNRDCIIKVLRNTEWLSKFVDQNPNDK